MTQTPTVNPRPTPLLVRYQEATVMLAISSRTIHRLVAQGELPTIGRGRGRRLTMAGIEAFIARQTS